MGIFTVATGMTTSFAWAIVWLSGLGIAAGLFIVPLNAFLQDRADPVEKGRILTTNNFINMLGVILASGTLSLMHDMLHMSAAHMLLVMGAFTAGRHHRGGQAASRRYAAAVPVVADARAFPHPL